MHSRYITPKHKHSNHHLPEIESSNNRRSLSTQRFNMLSPGRLPQNSVVKQPSPYQAMSEFLRENLNNS